MDDLRIVSLIASATEIVCALGFEDRLVGRSHECDYPPSVKRLPQVTSPKFKTDGTSYEINERVKAIVAEGLSVYRVDADLLEKLSPSCIITQDQCEVCAVSLRDVEQAVCQITRQRTAVVSLRPHCLADLWADIERVGVALGAVESSRRLVERLKLRMEQIASTAHRVASRPKAVVIEWIDPLMAGGNWMPELVDMAGGVSLVGEPGKHSPWMSWDELLARDPDVLVITPCGFDMARTLEEMHLLSGDPRWKRLKCARADRVFVADGNQFFNRPGPRIVESLEIMAEVLHPEVFSFGHERSGWLRYSGGAVR